MSLTVTNLTDDDCGICVKPGIYKSEKGTYVMVPEGSSNGRTELSLNMEVCLVLDADSERTFLKKKCNLKGKYTYVCSWDDTELVLGICNNDCC